MRRSTASKTVKFFAASAALGFSASSALAGGLEVREQSTFFQGMSFAGAAAAGDSLSSMFWNPAAASIAPRGLTTESNFALILPKSELTADSIGGAPLGGLCAAFDCEVDIGRDAIVPASYLAWRYDSKTVFALSMNSQFGLGTKPDNIGWVGAAHSQTAKLFSINLTPTVAYEIMPGLSIGAGVQIQYVDLKRFKSSVGVGVAEPNVNLTMSDIDIGFTLGVNFKPTRTTSIGIGYRSKISHDLDGSLIAPTGVGPVAFNAQTSLETPEKVTASIRQELSSNLRVLATAEWVNWSRAETHPVITAAAPNLGFEFEWDDGWFFALGGEYDVNDKLTVRAGGAYEISPIQNPSQRLLQVPDADRIWASIGATYKLNEHMSFDFAYSHVFVDEERFEGARARLALAPAAIKAGNTLGGTAESSVDIISVGLKMNLPPLD